MTLKIVSPNTPAEGAPPAPPVASAPTPVGRAPGPGASWMELLVRGLISWPVVLPALMLCSATLTWSFGARLRNDHRLIAVQARALKPVEVSGQPVTVEELAQRRTEARLGVAQLFEQPQEIGAALGELERTARELGWRVVLTMQTAQRQAGGFADLTLHPVQVRLDDESNNPRPAFDRLLAWLRAVSTSPKRVEIASLHLRSAGASLAGAQLELHLFSYHAHEANPAE